MFNNHEADSVMIEVSYLYKAAKHFGLSFASDAPEIWNDLPDDVQLATSLSSFRKKFKPISLLKHIHPSFTF